MFDLHPHPSQPVKRTPTRLDFKLGPDGKGLPPSLAANHDDYLVELTGDDDPANAKSWPFKRKLRSAAVLGFDTLASKLLGEIFPTSDVSVVLKVDYS